VSLSLSLSFSLSERLLEDHSFMLGAKRTVQFSSVQFSPEEIVHRRVEETLFWIWSGKRELARGPHWTVLPFAKCYTLGLELPVVESNLSLWNNVAQFSRAQQKPIGFFDSFALRLSSSSVLFLLPRQQSSTVTPPELSFQWHNLAQLQCVAPNPA